MRRRFYNIELFDKEEINTLKQYLKECHYYYEASDCGKGVHFEIKLNRRELEQVGTFIENEFCHR